MGFFLGKRSKNGWHVGFGSNGFYVAKTAPDGSYFGWSAGGKGKQEKSKPMTARQRAVVAGMILMAAALVWWGLSAWEAQVKADQQAQAQEKLTAALTEQINEIDVMKYHTALDIALNPREDGLMDADFRFTIGPDRNVETYLNYASVLLKRVDPDLLEHLASVTLEVWEPVSGSASQREWTLTEKHAAGDAAD